MAAGNIATILMEPEHNCCAPQVTKVKYCEVNNWCFRSVLSVESVVRFRLTWTIAVTHFYFITGRSQSFLDFFRDHH